MKVCSILVLGVSIFWTELGFGQAVAPVRAEWRKSFGRDSAEREPCLVRTCDGGFLLGGHSYSGVESGTWDYWAIRLDTQCNKVWDAVFGGAEWDLLRVVTETPDDGFLLVGDSQSQEGYGNKSAALLGQDDVWVVRLDATGKKLWDKSYGGIYSDQARAVLQISDGGFPDCRQFAFTYERAEIGC